MKKLILFAGLYCMLPGLYAASIVKSSIITMAPVSASERAKAHFKENFRSRSKTLRGIQRPIIACIAYFTGRIP